MGSVPGTVTSQDFCASDGVWAKTFLQNSVARKDSDRPGLLVFPPGHRIVGYPLMKDFIEAANVDGW